MGRRVGSSWAQIGPLHLGREKAPAEESYSPEAPQEEALARVPTAGPGPGETRASVTDQPPAAGRSAQWWATPVSPQCESRPSPQPPTSFTTPPPSLQRERWREKPRRLTGLSHPGDGETGEAEEQDCNERDQLVHALGPHGGGPGGTEQRGGWRLGEGRGLHHREALQRWRTLPKGSLGPAHMRPALRELPHPLAYGSALRMGMAWEGCW